MMMRRACTVRAAASTQTTTTTMKPSMVALNITKNSLINSQDGQTTSACAPVCV